MKRTITRLALTAGLVAGLGGAAASSALAAAGAVVTKPSHVVAARDGKSASAQLNGVINTGGQAATWVFEYGPTTKYGEFTSTNGFIPAGTTGNTNVSAIADDLKPGRKRVHYRLDVVLLTKSAVYYPYTFLFSGDISFRTPSFGKVTFPHKRDVSRKTHRSVFALRCASRFVACKGKASLTIHNKRTQIVCYALDFNLRPGQTAKNKPKFSPGCYDRLVKAGGKLNAVFTERTTTGQPRLQEGVKLRLV